MKVALIDTGISKNEINNRCEVRHFSLSKEVLIEEYNEPKKTHGTDCFKEIVLNTKNNKIQILDLNILDESGNLQVFNIISAIEKSIEEKVDIINISLGLTTYSQELYDICEKAIQNNIVIVSAASHANTISFPADFKNVICVKVDQKQKEKIRTIDYTTISISMRDFLMKEKDIEFDFSTSSLACARLCGYLCNDLSNMPLNDKFKILSRKYNINLYRSDDISCNINLKESGINDILLNNRVAVVLFPANSLRNINNDYIHENIVAYYDHEKCDFYSFRDGKQTKGFDIIIILNSLYIDLEVPVSIKEKYKSYKIICIGNFLKEIDDNKYLYDYSKYNSSELSVLEKPVIAITSLCSELNKSDIQFLLLNSLKQDGLDIESVTNNPIGVLYNTTVFNFPNEIKFPEIVYSINKYMYLSEINKDMDAWLINIGGAIGQVNMLNTYNFGKLADAYFSAANIDVAIMCVNPSIDVANLKLQLAHLYKHGIEKIFIVLSHNDIDTSTMSYRNGLQTYYIDNIKYFNAFEYLNQNVKEKVFTLDDVKDGKLYKNIIETLS
ncbi:S8 family serine peptidase [Paraclostridium sordellii]|uniref:S8 family serine peptidase n=1 Tax=Paraclostridium sordellii TaxID=1505 RepID=UPI001C615314|nr:S8 family serine peptidase [Paeniclostridium sordellii]QYE99746.1 S8 family serine peptidase [Paeniclostridium sordellii]